MTDSSGTWTRRRFLHAAGQAGGAAAVYETMVALGMLRVPSAAHAQLRIPAGAGDCQTIVILGAGVAGLTAAYELHKQRSGFNIIILEATGRVGGRSHTVRTGDEIVEHHGNDVWRQPCKFDHGLYLNAGPGRIPYHHTVALNYCRELKVPVEPYVMSSRANLYQEPKYFAEAQANRRILNDTRGYIAELLAKAIDQGSLDDTLPAAQRRQMLELLQTFGLLQPDRTYTGSQRSGYVVQPGVTTPGTIEPPIPRADLLASEFWRDRLYQPEDYEWQPTLFQPVGGMDMLARGFLPAVGPFIRKERAVTAVANQGEKVVIRHRGPSGDVETITADWCISTIPLWIFKDVVDRSTVSKAYADALAAPQPAPTCKVGWQANRRFWELDGEIYGGISYINHNITQMWYPSNGYLFEEKGVLTGAYNYGKNAITLGNQSLRQRLDTAIQGGERLHGRAFIEAVPRDLGLSIAWQYVPFQKGGWADWSKVAPVHYETLLYPDGRIVVAGDQVSYLPGWQEGAMLSAHHVLRTITERDARRVSTQRQTVVPNTRAVTEGSGPGRD